MAHRFADNPEVQAFARQELEKYYRAVTGVSLENSRFGRWTCQKDPMLDAALDEWAVRVSAGGVQIVGAHNRAILYGVYAVCTQVLGICFVRPGYEVVPSLAEERLSLSSFGRKAAFPVRGYTVDRPISCSDALDALAKMGYNTFALSATYWEAHRDMSSHSFYRRKTILRNTPNGFLCIKANAFLISCAFLPCRFGKSWRGV